MKTIQILIACAALLLPAACSTSQVDRAVAGGAIGGLAGAAIGGAVSGTGGGALVGAAVGATSGAIVGAATAPQQQPAVPRRQSRGGQQQSGAMNCRYGTYTHLGREYCNP